MALPLATALQYVRRCTFSGRDYRKYAVSDFLLYRHWIYPPVTTMREYHKTWALYLKWVGLVTANPTQYSSANGKRFTTSSAARSFRFTPGPNQNTAPTLAPAARGPLPANTYDATLEGVGQCEYFAMQAFQALKVGGVQGTVPRVEKVATPGHNWVLVNRSLGAANKADWIAVDYWLLALGVPMNRCVCTWQNATLGFGAKDDEIEVVDTYNPYNET